MQSDKNAERIKFSCPKIVGDNLDLSKFSVRINFENVSSVDSNVSIKDQYICDDVAVDGENVTFSWLIGKNAARYMGTVRFIVCAVKTDSDSNISVEWNTAIAEVPVLEGIEIDQPQIGQEEKDVINQLLELTKNTSAEAVQNVNSAKEQAIKDIQSVSQPDTTLTVEGGLAEAKTTGEAIGSLKEDLGDVYNVYTSKNLFNTDNETVGKYLNPQYGSYVSDVKWNTTNYIEIEDNSLYILSYDEIKSLNKIPYYIYCWYDSTKTYISGGSGNANAIQSPDNAKYIRISYSVAQKSYIQFEKGNSVTPYEPFYYPYKKIEKSLIKNRELEVFDGACLRSVFNQCDASKDNPYTVILNEGTYNTLDGYTSEEISADKFYGLYVPEFVTLIGKGDREKIVLTAEFSSKNTMISTLNLSGSANLQNIMVKGKMTRYAVHDDFPYTDDYCIRNVKDCIFEVTQAGYGSAYGSGVRSGAVWNFENCVFKCDSNEPFLVHSQNSIFKIPADITLKNCKMICKGSMALRVGGMNSGVKNHLHLIGCDLFGIRAKEEFANSGSGIDWIIDGYGNTPNMSTLIVTSKENDNFSFAFSDEYRTFKCAVPISKGYLVYQDDINIARAMSNIDKAVGIAMQDGNVGDMILVKTKGMVDVTAYMGITATTGDKIVISNGTYSVDNDAQIYIGRCAYANQMKIMLG